MKLGLLRAIALVFAFMILPAGISAATGDHYALATSTDTLYLLRAEGTWADAGIPGLTTGPASSILTVGNFSGGQVTGVAAFGEWIYLIDASTNSLVVGKLSLTASGYDFTTTKSVSLTNTSSGLYVNRPKSLAVDADGGVYIIGESYTDNDTRHYSYAYVNGGTDWASPSVTVRDIANAPMADVAAFDYGGLSGAIISSLLTTGTASATYVNQTQSGTAEGTTRLDGSYSPGAVTTINYDVPYAYVLSHRSSFSDLDMFGSLDVIRAGIDGTPPTVVEHYDLSDHLDPQDIVSTMIDGVYYLAIIGKPTNYVEDSEDGLIPDPSLGPSVAWLVPLTPTGTPDFSRKQAYSWNASDRSVGQVLAASSDGQVLWSVHPNGDQQVRAWKFNTWGQSTSPSFTGTVSDTLTSVAQFVGLPVPEPSAFVGLASLLGAAAVLVRRRKR